MSIVFDNVEYDFVPPPPFNGYKPVRIAPKVRFQAVAGYTQQREQYPVATKKIPISFELLTDAERNFLAAFIDQYKSEPFWYVLPTSLKPRPNGKIYPVGIWCRIIDDEIPEEPTGPEFTWHSKITLESIGPEVIGTPPDE